MEEKKLIKKVFSSQSQNKLTPLFIFIFKPLLEFLIASNILLLTIATQTHLKTKLSVSTKEKNICAFFIYLVGLRFVTFANALKRQFRIHLSLGKTELPFFVFVCSVSRKKVIVRLTEKSALWQLWSIKNKLACFRYNDLL